MRWSTSRRLRWQAAGQRHPPGQAAVVREDSDLTIVTVSQMVRREEQRRGRPARGGGRDERVFVMGEDIGSYGGARSSSLLRGQVGSDLVRTTAG